MFFYAARPYIAIRLFASSLGMDWEAKLRGIEFEPQDRPAACAP